MLKVEEVSWNRSQDSATQEDRSTGGFIQMHWGKWNNCQCQIVPLYRMPGMYRATATLLGDPTGFREARNLTAQGSLT